MWLHDIRSAIFHEACSMYGAHLPWCHSQHGTESEFFEFIIRQDETLGSFDWAHWLHDIKYSLLLNEHVIFDSRDTSCDTVINIWSSAPQRQGLPPHSGHHRGAGWVTRHLRPHTLRRCYMLRSLNCNEPTSQHMCMHNWIRLRIYLTGILSAIGVDGTASSVDCRHWRLQG